VPVDEEAERRDDLVSSNAFGRLTTHGRRSVAGGGSEAMRITWPPLLPPVATRATALLAAPVRTRQTRLSATDLRTMSAQ
jgi:hypothetical protein